MNTILLVLLVICISIVFLIGIYQVNPHKRLFAALTVSIPVADFITDFIYVFKTDFVNSQVFAAAAFFLVISNILFVHELVIKKAYYKPSPWAMQTLWLGYRGYRPTIKGSLVSALDFDHFDDIPKIFLFLLIWFVLATLQILFFIPFFVFAVLPGILMFLLGSLLHTLKILSVGRIWNLWFLLWTANDRFETDIDLDTGVLNKALFAEFLLETVPQLAIQVSVYAAV